jgi:phosphatidylinositol alpha-1,6-mannosyltransferase
VQRKGQDALIRAMAQLKDKYSDAHLLIAGAGNYEGKLRRLAVTQKVEDRITFVGRVPFAELPDLFRTADIFASPTRDRFGGLEVEGLGIVYLEASASGLPVIAGASGGSPDAVISGQTGLVVDGRDIAAIAQALDHLLGDATARKSMGEHGRRWMESQWSWEIMGERFRRLLELN